jgi:hypothetical protein
MNDHHYFWREDEHEPRELHIHDRLEWARRKNIKILMVTSAVACACVAVALLLKPM